MTRRKTSSLNIKISSRLCGKFRKYLFKNSHAYQLGTHISFSQIRVLYTYFPFSKKKYIYIYMCIARKENSSQNIQQHISSKEGSISVIKGT